MSENRIQVPVTNLQSILNGTWLNFNISTTYQLDELKIQEKNIAVEKECMTTYLKSGAQCNIRTSPDNGGDPKSDHIINIYNTQPGKRKHNN